MPKLLQIRRLPRWNTKPCGRQETDAAYRAVVKRLNALAEVNGETDYLEIINNINRLIDRQKAILATRKTINAKRATQKPEGGGKPGEERPGEL